MSGILQEKISAVEYAPVFKSNLSDCQFDPLDCRIPGFLKGIFEEHVILGAEAKFNGFACLNYLFGIPIFIFGSPNARAKMQIPG